MGIQRDGAVGTGDPDRDAAVIAYFGDGATSQGDVNEAFIFAASTTRPVVFFCQNNQWAISEPIERQTRIPLYQRALGFGFPGVRVDGNDVLAVLRRDQGGAASAARERPGPDARRGVHLPDGRAHHVRRPDPLPARRRGRGAGSCKDPIERVKAYLARNGMADEAFFDARRRRGRRARPPTCARAARRCPTRRRESMFDHVYAEQHPLRRGGARASSPPTSTSFEGEAH